MRIVKMYLSESAYLAIDKHIILWKIARIQIKDRADYTKKLILKNIKNKKVKHINSKLTSLKKIRQFN